MTKILYENAGGVVQENKKSNWWNISKIINDLVASANEMRTDHLGSGTSYQVWATEVTTDHASTKTAVDTSKTLTDELRTNNDLDVTLDTELKADIEVFRDFLNYQHMRDGVIHVEDATLFTYNSGTKDRIDIPEFDYQIGGVQYHYAGASALDWDEGGETINLGTAASVLWGMWYGTINAAGTVAFRPTDVSGDSVWASEFAAFMSINGDADLTAIPAGEIVFATISVAMDASQTFTADTTAFDDANLTSSSFVMYTTVNDQVTSCSGTSGDGRVITAHSSVIINAGTAEQFDVVGTAVVYTGGTRASLAASATQTFTVADTINTGAAAPIVFGAWGLFRDASGNDFTLGADGSVVASDQVYADAATALTALDTLYIPAKYSRVGTIVIDCLASTAWIANTDDMTDASDCTTAVFAAQGAATAYEETANAATPVPPTLPGVISAPGKVGIVAAAATAGPGTLGSSVPGAHSASAVEDTTWRLLGAPT